jgi:serine protease Do
LIATTGLVIGVLVSRLSDRAALEETGMLPQNVNYALKSAYVLPLLEGARGMGGINDRTNTETFEDVVREVEAATVLVLAF